MTMAALWCNGFVRMDSNCKPGTYAVENSWTCREKTMKRPNWISFCLIHARWSHFFSVFDLFKSYNCNLSCVLRQRCPQQTLVGLKSWIPVWDGNGEPTQFQTALYSITNEHGCNVITVSDMENLLYIWLGEGYVYYKPRPCRFKPWPERWQTQRLERNNIFKIC